MFPFSKKSAGALLIAAFTLQSVLFLFVSSVGAAPAKVVIWDHFIHDKKYTTKMYKEFNKKNKDVQIDYTSQVASAYVQILPLAFRTGEPPDIFFSSGLPAGATIENLTEWGWIQSLEEIAPSEAAFKAWKARFPAAKQPFLEGFNVLNGKVFSFPRIDVNSEALRFLFVNTKLFREAGLEPKVPKTWSDLRRAARVLTEKGQKRYYGIGLPLKDYIGTLAVSLTWTMALAGGHPGYYGFDYRTGRYDFTNAGLRGAIQLWLDMKADGSVMPGDLSTTDEEVKRYFANDKVGILFGGWWNPSNFLAYNPGAEFDVGLGPTPDDGIRRVYATVGPAAAQQGYFVSKKTKNPGAVWKVIEFITSPEFQEGYVKGGYGVSIFPEYNTPENLKTPGMAKIAQFGVTATRVGPQLSKEANKVYDYWEEPRPHLYDHIVAMYLGKENLSVLDPYEKKMNDQLDIAIKKAQTAGIKMTRKDFIFPDWDPAKDYVPAGKK